MYDLESLILGFASNIFAFYRSKKKIKIKEINYFKKYHCSLQNLPFEIALLVSPRGNKFETKQNSETIVIGQNHSHLISLFFCFDRKKNFIKFNLINKFVF